eukprot:4462782-Amphidinium_carterae.2
MRKTSASIRAHALRLPAFSPHGITSNRYLNDYLRKSNVPKHEGGSSQFPDWATAFIEGGPKSDSAHVAGGPSDSHAHDDADVDTDSEEIVAGCFKMDLLDEQRMAMKDNTEMRQRDLFKWSMLGGEWAVQRQGKVVVGPRVDIRHGTEFHEFASKHLPNMSASFTHDKYGDAFSVALAELWTEMMMHLYESWLSVGRPADAQAVPVVPFTVPETLAVKLEHGNAACTKRAREITSTKLRSSTKA